jgi:DNA-binding NtrC family response regulator
MQAIIFVTDDEQATRSDIAKPLTRQGHHVVGMNSAKSCWRGLNTTFLTLCCSM